MRKSGRAILLATTIIAACAAMLVSNSGRSAEKISDTYDINTFLDPDWELAMHEVFTHYIQAAANFGQENYDTAIAFLKVMEYYINMLPDRIPAKTPDGRRVDRARFLKDIENMRENTISLRRMIEQKEYRKVSQTATDFITDLCVDCHKKAQVPPKWEKESYQ